MILIFSNSVEPSTARVINWINNLGGRWFRINSIVNDGMPDVITNIMAELNDQQFSITLKKGQKSLAARDINVIWYRRFQIKDNLNLSLEEFEKSTDSEIRRFRTSEKIALFRSLVYRLEDKFWLSHPDTAAVNKIMQLDIARKLEIIVPKTWIISSKEQLKEVLKIYPKLALKPIKDIRPISMGKKFFNQYTTIIEMDFLDHLNDEPFPFLVQEYISKDYEVRSFFIDDEFYSMAIFSQDNDQTTVDFRRYDYKYPNRNVPFKLPVDIDQKLKKLLRRLKLNTGSIDLLVSGDKYYFLEVNPVGQFGMVSSPCNYHLHKKIAQFLIKQDNA
ncbi:grasp-with-spasm system ATP-grasp peptide maturase [Marinoscillum pacificum]|uniref:grasp-with-spasm system ATP-grasp peptide maturase n=1 Tax=Marinoscillum pacificum TaxID=392723 RepID=UPI002157C6F3|nr:grasp-with-spasm system ATP-grasp peptide maturase [Marinoscillum pacificum]